MFSICSLRFVVWKCLKNLVSAEWITGSESHLEQTLTVDTIENVGEANSSTCICRSTDRTEQRSSATLYHQTDQTCQKWLQFCWNYVFLGNLQLELSPRFAKWFVIVVKFIYTNDNYCNHYPFAKIQEFSTSHRGIQSQGTARSLMRAWTKWTHRCDTDHQAIYIYIFFFIRQWCRLDILDGLLILWVVPPPSNSHHQDYCIFSRRSQPKPSFATVTVRGDNPTYTLPPRIMVQLDQMDSSS